MSKVKGAINALQSHPLTSTLGVRCLRAYSMQLPRSLCKQAPALRLAVGQPRRGSLRRCLQSSRGPVRVRPFLDPFEPITTTPFEIFWAAIAVRTFENFFRGISKWLLAKGEKKVK